MSSEQTSNHDSDTDYESDTSDNEEEYYDAVDSEDTQKEKKRAHHNELERKRRDAIKDSFVELRNVINYVDTNTKNAISRVQVLSKSIEYISNTSENIDKHQKEINELKESILELENYLYEIYRSYEGIIDEALVYEMIADFERNGGSFPDCNEEVLSQKSSDESSQPSTSDSPH